MRGDFRMQDNKKHNRYFFCCASWISKNILIFSVKVLYYKTWGISAVGSAQHSHC